MIWAGPQTYRCLGKGRAHGADRVLDEPRFVDVGVVSDNVAGDLVEDLLAPAHSERIERRECEQKVSEHGFLCSEHVLTINTDPGAATIRRNDGVVIPARTDEVPWTTPEMLRLEAGIVASALRRRAAGAGAAESAAIDAVIADQPSLSGEQQAMVRALCGSGDGIEVVEGAAGAGKTFRARRRPPGMGDRGLPREIEGRIAGRDRTAKSGPTGPPRGARRGLTGHGRRRRRRT